MKIGIMQPYIFPYVGYYQLIKCVDKFVVYDDVNFIKQGWINRNNILLNGQRHTFSVPIKNLSSFTPINETTINDQLYPKWKDGFLKTLELNYKKAPFFKDAFQTISSVFNSSATHISALAVSSISCVFEYLELSINIVETSGVYNNSDLKGVNRVMDICKREQGDTYINAAGGQELYSKEEFKANGLIRMRHRYTC